MVAETYEKLSMAGKVAVVTGGTQGLGEATAHLFAERGAKGLVICGRNAENGARVKSSLEAKGTRTVYVKADLAGVEDCRKVITEADKAFGHVDVLVNAAAITDRGTIWDTEPTLFDAMVAVNVRAPFFLMQDAAKLMKRENRNGTMVNIISMSGHGGQPFITAYCASKGALITLTKNVAFSLMRHGVRVNGLCIGWTDTPGEDRIMKMYHEAADGWLQQAEASLPFGRLLKPDEVARATAYLSTDESGLMTGSIIDFDQQVLGCYERAPQPAPLN
ncbi:MAG TPA: SDR family oxidoreductase [Aestuariivirgaceae bacterium]|nr:SDR family oxidoreductase [Aestuariivirgaceae bacterium]